MKDESFLKKGLYDIHCHIIPGVDDGAADLEETKKMLAMEYEQGVRGIIATPHFRKGMFETPVREIHRQFDLLQECAKEIGQELQVYLGCEFHVNLEMVRLLKEGRVSTMADSSYVLVEFPEDAQDFYIEERLRSLVCVGYRPVIAHVERCEVLREVELIRDLVTGGSLIQVNADSVLGNCGFFTKRFCNKLMKKDLLHFVASDCHGSKVRVCNIRAAYEQVCRKMGEEYANRIFIDNPSKILRNAQNRRKF